MTLRPMLMTDADFMLELKHYPETKQFSLIAYDEIKREDHLKYIEQYLEHFQIIEGRNGDALGALRIQDNEVSIWISRNYWEMGFATFVLQRHTNKGMTAKIVPANIASMRCFIRAGFLPKSFQDGYYIFQKV